MTTVNDTIAQYSPKWFKPAATGRHRFGAITDDGLRAIKDLLIKSDAPDAAAEIEGELRERHRDDEYWAAEMRRRTYQRV